MRKGLIFSGIILSFFFLESCMSNPKFEGKGDFPGIVVNENNEPVNQCIVRAFKDGENLVTTTTNSNGVFVLRNISSGKYKISVEKENYLLFEDSNVHFFDRNNFLACEIISYEGFFEQIDLLIDAEDYSKALKKLEMAKIKKNPDIENLSYFYKAFLFEKLGKQELFEKEVRKIRDKNLIEKKEMFISKMECKNEN